MRVSDFLGYQQKLVAQSGYVPSWAKPGGRWAAQKTFVSYRELFTDIADFCGGYVWIPRGRFSVLARGGQRQDALSEFAAIPFACRGCDWRGPASDTLTVGLLEWEPGIESAPTYARLALDQNPNAWQPTCPQCGAGSVSYEVGAIRVDKIYRRWLLLGARPVEYPICDSLDSRNLGIIPLGSRNATIREVEALLKQEELLAPQELVYIAQQLWPSLAETLRSIT